MHLTIGLAALAAAFNLASQEEWTAVEPEAQLLELLAYAQPYNLGDTPVDEARDHVRRNAGSADAWHALGQSLDAAGDLEGALAAYEEAVALPPVEVGRAYLYRELAEARERSGDMEGALAAARVSVRSWPKSQDGLHCAGYEERMLTRILIESGDPASAQTFYAPLVDAELEECVAIDTLLGELMAGSEAEAEAEAEAGAE